MANPFKREQKNFFGKIPINWPYNFFWRNSENEMQYFLEFYLKFPMFFYEIYPAPLYMYGSSELQF